VSGTDNTSTTTEPVDHLRGASVWQEDLYEALMAHMANEGGIVDAYATFAEETSSETVRYLVRLILDDERRHHRILLDLANAVRAEATLELRDGRVPFMDVHAHDEALHQATERFLAAEREDLVQLRRLIRQAAGAGGTELEEFVLGLLREDTERHIKILKFIERLVRHSPLP
jgi:rubrerythrin